jgi:hypothetical protein
MLKMYLEVHGPWSAVLQDCLPQDTASDLRFTKFVVPIPRLRGIATLKCGAAIDSKSARKKFNALILKVLLSILKALACPVKTFEALALWQISS